MAFKILPILVTLMVGSPIIVFKGVYHLALWVKGPTSLSNPLLNIYGRAVVLHLAVHKCMTWNGILLLNSSKMHIMSNVSPLKLPFYLFQIELVWEHSVAEVAFGRLTRHPGWARVAARKRTVQLGWLTQIQRHRCRGNRWQWSATASISRLGRQDDRPWDVALLRRESGSVGLVRALECDCRSWGRRRRHRNPLDGYVLTFCWRSWFGQLNGWHGRMCKAKSERFSTSGQPLDWVIRSWSHSIRAVFMIGPLLVCDISRQDLIELSSRIQRWPD